VVLEPEGPQRADLATDIAAALDAAPEAAAFFDSLAQFYRTAWLRWIDSTKRRPDQRPIRIRGDGVHAAARTQGASLTGAPHICDRCEIHTQADAARNPRRFRQPSICLRRSLTVHDERLALARSAPLGPEFCPRIWRRRTRSEPAWLTEELAQLIVECPRTLKLGPDSPVKGSRPRCEIADHRTSRAEGNPSRLLANPGLQRDPSFRG
jgi:hypothetical protein